MKKLILETDRLSLFAADPADIDDLISLRTDIEVMQCLGGFGQAFGTGVIQDVDEIKYQLSLSPGYYDAYGLGFFSAFEKSSGDFIGQAGLFHIGFNTAQPDIELAYRLHRRFWGKGYATELATALIDWGFNVRKLTKIVAAVHPGNERSIRVLEKAGMHYDGIIDWRGDRLPGYSIEKMNDKGR